MKTKYTFSPEGLSPAWRSIVQSLWDNERGWWGFMAAHHPSNAQISENSEICIVTGRPDNCGMGMKMLIDVAVVKVEETP